MRLRRIKTQVFTSRVRELDGNKCAGDMKMSAEILYDKIVPY